MLGVSVGFAPVPGDNNWLPACTPYYEGGAVLPFTARSCVPAEPGGVVPVYSQLPIPGIPVPATPATPASVPAITPAASGSTNPLAALADTSSAPAMTGMGTLLAIAAALFLLLKGAH